MARESIPVGVCAFPGIGNYEKSFPGISGRSGTALQLSNLQASVSNTEQITYSKCNISSQSQISRNLTNTVNRFSSVSVQSVQTSYSIVYDSPARD